MSTIKRIVVQSFDYELEDFGANPMIFEKGGKHRFSKFAVTVETDDGHSGSYIPHLGGTGHALAQVKEMAPGLIGRDAEQREKTFEDLKLGWRHFDKLGIAALDAALWDLAGKKYDAPVARLLGGYRQRLPAYASTYPGQASPGGLDSVEAYADFAEDCVSRGFPGFKIHGFMDGKPESEIAIMTAIRERVGKAIKLMTDPASSLPSFLAAVEVGRACDDLGLYWYEDPYRDASSSAVAHKRLREFVRTPLMIAEHIRGFEQKADFVLAGGTDILHIDPEMDGGITGTIKLARFAEALGMEVQLHTAAPIHRHCMAAIPNTLFYELGLVRPDAWNGFQPPVYACDYGDQLDNVGADGCVAVPDGPGLGVIYDWDKIKHWETAREVFE